MPDTEKNAAYRKSQKLKLLILDVDGVLTDGKLFFDNAGNEYKYSMQDGHALSCCVRPGRGGGNSGRK